MVQQLLETSSTHFKNGGGIPELSRYQEHIPEYKILLSAGFNCVSVMFQGQVESDKRMNLLFGEVTQHYHVIANLTGAMAKRHVCEACNKWCKYCVEHICDQTCSDCMLSPPCVSAGFRIACASATDNL